MELNEVVHVRRPVSAVFEAWSRSEWAALHGPAAVERTKLTDGPAGRGTRYRAVDRWPGRLVTYTVEITAFERPERVAATWSNPLSGGWDAIFEPRGDSTELRFHATINPSGFAGLPLRLLLPWYRRQIGAFLEAFRDSLEADAD